MLDVLDRFVRLISPKSIFMGEKDFQQFFLVKNFIEKNYNTRVYLCKTVRDSDMIALSSRNNLLNKTNHKTLGLVINRLINLKKTIYKDRQNSKKKIVMTKKDLIKKFNIKFEYLECRNINNLSTNINNKSFKLFMSCYLNKVNHPSKNMHYAMSKGIFGKYQLNQFQDDYFKNMNSPNPMFLKRLDEAMDCFIWNWESFKQKYQII